MGLIYAITVAAIVWLVYWAVGGRSIDAALFAIGIIVAATAINKVISLLPGRSSDV